MMRPLMNPRSIRRGCSPSTSLQAVNRRDAMLLSSLLLSSLPTQPSKALLIDDENLTSNIFNACSSSVVSIVNFKGTSSQVVDSVGSGVIWDSDGFIVTNSHVISKIDKSTIRTSTKALLTDEATGLEVSYDLALTGSDAAHDLAVLKITGPTSGEGSLDLKPVRVSHSSALRVGQYAFAIGNPGGKGKVITAGVLSGLGRSIPSPVGTRIYGVLQTDATINSGNSGGGLFDSSGNLIGISTATYTRSGSGKGSGVNFALPSDLLLSIVPNLIEFGNASGKIV
jgi:S1-C subfamily serine protease